jgi:hypothetical protein
MILRSRASIYRKRDICIAIAAIAVVVLLMTILSLTVK